MKTLALAIDVAADYAAHLHQSDGVPKEKAIQIGAQAVVRAVRSNPRGFVPHRKPKLKPSGVGFSGDALMGAGSLLSAVGWIKNIVTGG